MVNKMDIKFVIEVHKGEDYFGFKVNGKDYTEWDLTTGQTMYGLLLKFLKGLVKK